MYRFARRPIIFILRNPEANSDIIMLLRLGLLHNPGLIHLLLFELFFSDHPNKTPPRRVIKILLVCQLHLGG